MSTALPRLGRDRIRYVFDADQEPVLEVEDGERFWVELQDAHSGTITGPEVVYESLEEVFRRIGGANPVTGPVALGGVRPGDCLEIDLLSIDPAPVTGYGYMCTTPTLHPDLTAETVICPLEEGRVRLPDARGGLSVNAHPFVGTIGVAPASGSVPSFRQRRDVLGNVDTPEITAGATVVLRANRPGGLVSFGDPHLCQGDAEIHRSAVEAQADLLIRMRRKGRDEVGFVELPQVNTRRRLGSLAPGPGHLEELIRVAYDDLALRLHRFYGYRLAEAYRLLGAAGRVRIGQVVPPLYSALVTVDRRLAERTEDHLEEIPG